MTMGSQMIEDLHSSTIVNLRYAMQAECAGYNKDDVEFVNYDVEHVTGGATSCYKSSGTGVTDRDY